jgi:hypothetical protein
MGIPVDRKDLRGIGMNHSTWKPTGPSKRKVIYFIRHGEAEHNVAPFNFQLADPFLTHEGKFRQIICVRWLRYALMIIQSLRYYRLPCIHGAFVVYYGCAMRS